MIVTPAAFVLLLALAPAMDPEAEERFKQGLQQYQNKEYADAVQQFRVAYALDPRAEILFAWAQAERLYGRCSRATKLYRRFLTSRPSAQQAEAARQGVERCKDQPDTAPADPDDLEDVPPPAPEPAAAPDPDPDPDPTPPPPKARRVDPLGVGLLAGGVVVAGVGAGLLGAAAGKARGLDDDAADYDQYIDGVGAVRTLRVVGGVMAGVGAALIVTGVVRLAVRARAPRRDVSMWADPTGAGVVMRMRF